MSNSNSPIKKVFAIHDLSCFGRCSLAVIIPTLSALGLQAIPIPTALLSTHTGGFTDLFFQDMSSAMKSIKEHYERIGLQPDAIYSGFLGSSQQIEIVIDYIETFTKPSCPPCPVIVDPVMGDDGEIYSTYTKELMFGMRSLCAKADIITPNLTEACFLTDTEYKTCENCTEAQASKYALELCNKMHAQLGTQKIALTGIHFSSNKIGTYVFEEKTGKMHSQPSLSKNYPGTGDIFASVLLGKLLKGSDFTDAAVIASQFIHDTIEYTMQWDTPIREGVLLEGCLHQLLNK